MTAGSAFAKTPAVHPDDIRPGDPEFWMTSRAERAAAFATLRRERPVAFHQEPEVPGLGRGPGFWSVTRHADVMEVSRNGQLFSSGRGGVNMIDQPEFFAELFGSMIAMDDPRHARLRRIVSHGFTPSRLRNVMTEVECAAVEIVDGVIDRGRCDFVTDVAAMLPLKIICDMMGIPASEYRYVFDRTNVTLGATDPQAAAHGDHQLTHGQQVPAPGHSGRSAAGSGMGQGERAELYPQT